jgi:hypothetical protein
MKRVRGSPSRATPYPEGDREIPGKIPAKIPGRIGVIWREHVRVAPLLDESLEVNCSRGSVRLAWSRQQEFVKETPKSGRSIDSKYRSRF